MRFTWRVFLIFIALVVCISVATAASNAAFDDDDSKVDITNEDADLVTKNPGYVEPRDNDDDEEASSDDEDKANGKEALSKAMKRSRATRRRNIKLFKKHSFRLTMIVALYAFRREIKSLLWYIASAPVRDPETGEVIRRRLKLTSILKIVVFVDLMRRMQSSAGGDQKMSPLAALLLSSSGSNPALAIMLSKMLSPTNNAFVPPVEQHYTFERINSRHTKDSLALQKAMNIRRARSSEKHSMSLASILKSPDPPVYNDTVILMEMTLDTTVSQIDVLRDQISFLLTEYNGGVLSKNATINGNATDVEVVVLLESPGGSAADYALAAQQIIRLRNSGIKVTICVDKVAASGGYMIACTASPGCLLGAPFAVLGSIGVIGQAVNIHKTLKGWGVEPLVFRGGRDKAPVGLIGEVTKEGMAKVQNIVDNTHRAFKRHVVNARPMLADQIDKLASGDVWLGYEAVEHGLIDRLTTSDEYIGERLSSGACILKLVQLVKPRFPFARPSTSGSIGAKIQQLAGSEVIGILSDLQALIGRLVGAVKDVGLLHDEGLSAWTKAGAVGYNDLRLPSGTTN